MEIFKFCEIAQMKNLKEKMHWAVFWLIACKAVRQSLCVFLIFFSSIHFEKLKLYNQSIKATPHKALYNVFPRNAWHRKISKSVLDFVESCRM